MKKAQSLKVEGDWTFGHGVQVVGEVDARRQLGASGSPADTVLSTGSDA